METKLTLSIQKELAKSAKEYAKRNGKSLSGIIEGYLRILINSDTQKSEISPKVKDLLGSIKVEKDFDYKRELQKALAQKYQK